MRNRISIAKHVGILALSMIAIGCSQRSAPVAPNNYPIIRAQPQPVYIPPQQVYRPAPVSRPSPVYQPNRAYQRNPQTFNPRDQRNLPPPNRAPVVSEVGAPSAAPAPRARPFRPIPADDLVDNPYKAFDPSERERAENPAAARDTQAEAKPQPRGRTSDDYATLLGDEASEAGTAASTPNPAAQAPVAGAPSSGPPVIALLVPASDRRPTVRRLADGLTKAAKLAVSDMGGTSVQLQVYDTAGDPRRAATLAKEAIDGGAKMIIGPLFSGSAAAVRPVAKAANVSVVSFTTDRTALGDGVYSIGFLPDADVNRIIGYAARNDLRKIALLVPDSPFGGVIAQAGQRAARQAGAEIVQIQPFKDDFRSLDGAAQDFAKFYESAPQVDAVVIATNGKTLQGLAAYLAYRDVLPTKVKYLGLGLWDDKETFREATLRGGWFPGVDPALKTDFAYRYGQAHGGDPVDIALLGYDAVVVADALAKRGGFSQSALLSASGFSGMSGGFRFRPDGTNQRSLSVLEVGPSTFTIVDPAPAIGVQVSELAGG